MRPASAEENAGLILSFIGQVEILRGEEKHLPLPHAPFHSGDIFVTGEGQIQLRFADGTMLMLYRDTRFVVDDYHYEKGSGDRAQFSLLNGVIHTLTGAIDKHNYLLKTRLANLAVRGTEYSANLNDTLQVSVDKGRVELTNAGGSILVSAGQSITVNGQNVMPPPSTGGKIDLRMHAPGARGEHGTPDTHQPGDGGGPQGGNPPPPGTRKMTIPSSNNVGGGTGGGPSGGSGGRPGGGRPAP